MAEVHNERGFARIEVLLMRVTHEEVEILSEEIANLAVDLGLDDSKTGDQRSVIAAKPWKIRFWESVDRAMLRAAKGAKLIIIPQRAEE